MGSLQWNCVKHCKLYSVFRGQKSKKEKVKIKTQNEKLVETDINIWYYTYKKTVIRVRKKQCNVIIRKNNLQFVFKFPAYEAWSAWFVKRLIFGGGTKIKTARFLYSLYFCSTKKNGSFTWKLHNSYQN